MTTRFAFTLLLFFIALKTGIAQELNVEKIWKTYDFRSSGIEGFKSMKNGVNYTRIEEENGKQQIVKYDIADSQKKRRGDRYR